MPKNGYFWSKMVKQDFLLRLTPSFFESNSVESIEHMLWGRTDSDSRIEVEQNQSEQTRIWSNSQSTTQPQSSSSNHG